MPQADFVDQADSSASDCAISTASHHASPIERSWAVPITVLDSQRRYATAHQHHHDRGLAALAPRPNDHRPEPVKTCLPSISRPAFRTYSCQGYSRKPKARAKAIAAYPWRGLGVSGPSGGVKMRGSSHPLAPRSRGPPPPAVPVDLAYPRHQPVPDIDLTSASHPLRSATPRRSSANIACSLAAAGKCCGILKDYEQLSHTQRRSD